MLYEVFLVLGVVFFAGSVFLFASGGHIAVTVYERAAQGAFVLGFLGLYFLWCWLRGGQTLPMKAWKIRLVEVTPAKALLRFVLALVLVPSGVSILWAVLDRDRQFLHDRLAGTRLVNA
jgi:uncharacterized RDD family membrane protein YckC